MTSLSENPGRGSCAWAIATHPPDFSRTATLVSSIQQHGIASDPVVVFSTEDDYQSFKSSYALEFQYLVASDYVSARDLERFLDTRSIINVKKMIALWELKNHYEHVFTPDSECQVFRPGDPLATFSVRKARRSWPAHRHQGPFIRQILDGCIELFDVRDRKELRSMVVEAGPLYSWFQDIPGFLRDDLEAFFDYFGSSSSPEPICSAVTWWSFDHLLFQMFCCLRRGWTLTDVGVQSPDESSAAWEAWTLSHPECTADALRVAAQWPSSWARQDGLARDVPSVFMTYHLDR